MNVSALASAIETEFHKRDQAPLYAALFAFLPSKVKP